VASRSWPIGWPRLVVLPKARSLIHHAPAVTPGLITARPDWRHQARGVLSCTPRDEPCPTQGAWVYQQAMRDGHGRSSRWRHATTGFLTSLIQTEAGGSWHFHAPFTGKIARRKKAGHQPSREAVYSSPQICPRAAVSLNLLDELDDAMKRGASVLRLTCQLRTARAASS